MLRYTIRRLGASALVMILITMITFAIVQLAPGGPAILLDEQLSQQDRDDIRANLGLDKPLPVQYYRWAKALLTGDLGNSYMEREPVSHLLAQRLPNTLILAGAALLLAVAVGIPAGILSAARTHSWWDYSFTFLSVLGISIPTFWFGILLIILCSVNLGLLPSAGMYTLGAGNQVGDLLLHMVMPALVLALSPLAEIARYTRSSMLNVIKLDYIRTARAKGVVEYRVLFRHALKNALIPVVTVIGLLLPHLVGGSVIIEKIFAWPGMGRLAADAAFKRDYPVVMGITVVIALVVVAGNLTTDLLYGCLNPRIRWE
ncbi:MAG: binding-protein-dependent transport system inner rane component [Firmicutes bacterium]|nr:binding-protein-dependent transport system inner rane component [Bacillota bacterium]